MYDLVTFGEMLYRLSPVDGQRFLSTQQFDSYIGGAELNVAAGVAQLGGKCAYISQIPNNALGEKARRKVLSYKVSDEAIFVDEQSDGRMGIYYYEYGASPRKPEVIYDRKNSSFTQLDIDRIPEQFFQNVTCFHTSGINLALCENSRNNTIELIEKFRQNGTIISFDVNYRGNLWSGSQAKKCIKEILPFVDIFFCTEDTFRLTFEKEGCIPNIMKSFAKEFDIAYVCSSKRGVHSTTNHSFYSCIYEKKTDKFYEEDAYENIMTIDRIGSGDAYVSGTLYGILKYPEDIRRAVRYGNIMGVIKNTISGDMVEISAEEVEELIGEHKSGGRISELKR